MPKNIVIGIVATVIIVVGGGIYYFYPRINITDSTATPIIVWNLIAKENTDPAYAFNPTMPMTDIIVIIGNKQYTVATSYPGGCREITDASRLSKGELSAIICWWGGAGDEYGVFQEGGTLLVKTIGLDSVIHPESVGEYSHVGDFKVLQDVLSDKNARHLDPTSVVKTYQKLARAKSVADLKQSILGGSKLLVQKYDTDLGYHVSADLREYLVVRTIVGDQAVEAASDSLVNLYGPCWGIPDGECRE